MAAINISIPDDLKVRMDDVNVNWSALARTCFEARLALLAPADAEGLERLRAEKAEALEGTEDDHLEGVKDGKQWALDCASWSQLSGLATAQALKLLLQSPVETIDDIFYVVKTTADEEEMFGEEPNRTRRYAQGFMEGLVAIHAEV